MPGIKFLGRKWAIGSDDFVFPMLVENFVRVIWLALIVGTYSLEEEFSSTCEDEWMLRTYYLIMFFNLLFVIFINFMVVSQSMKGSIFDFDDDRKLVTPLLTFKIFCFLVELVFIIYGSGFIFFQVYDKCRSRLHLTLYFILGSCWFFYFIILVSFIFIFDPLGYKASETSFKKAREVWNKRCRLFCCFKFNSKNESFQQISSIFADFFYGTSLITTDILAGLMLLNGEQTKRYSTFSDVHSLEEKPKIPPADWMTTSNAHHFMKFALSSYGWLFFVMDNMCRNPCLLCCSCGKTRRFLMEKVKDDNCCLSNTFTILKGTLISKEDILYASFDNELFKLPFYLVVDHSTNSIVLSVRGTLSTFDAITDMVIEKEKMEIDFEGETFAHGGILKAAEHIRKVLLEENILEKATKQFPSYRLVITGHSLGAGVASLLSILLKPLHPNLVCFSFSPPGWLVSKDLIPHTEKFICSVILGKDLVPRLGVTSLLNLKHHVLDLLIHCSIPKYKIVLSTIFNNCCLLSSTPLPQHIFSKRMRAEKCQQLKQRFLEAEKELANKSHLDTKSKLYLAGKIMLLKDKTVYKWCSKATPHFEVTWSERKVFEEILVNVQMLRDHKPVMVLAALSHLVESRPPYPQIVFNPQTLPNFEGYCPKEEEEVVINEYKKQKKQINKEEDKSKKTEEKFEINEGEKNEMKKNKGEEKSSKVGEKENLLGKKNEKYLNEFGSIN